MSAARVGNAIARARMLADIARVELDAEKARELALEALEASKLCADAYSVLARLEADPERAEELHRRAMDAARTVIAEAFATGEAGRFGETEDTRPHLRALVSLVGDLAGRGKREEALLLGRDMLRLNPADPGHLRAVLVGPMIEADRDEEARELARAFWEDEGGTITLGRALLAFRGSGDSPEARRHLALALASWPRSVPYLLGEAPLPDLDGEEEAVPEEESEAATVASQMRSAFAATPGALEWLAEHRELRGTASLVWVENVAGSPAVAACRAAVRAMVCELAEATGLEAHVEYRPDGTAALRTSGDLPHVAELAGAILEEGFFGFEVEVEREDLTRAFDELEPAGALKFAVGQPSPARYDAQEPTALSYPDLAPNGPMG